MTDSKNYSGRIEIVLLISVLILSAYRFLHFGNTLEEPSLWRQADTYFYAYNFYRDGLDLLHPAVSWMGNHKTLILEFPLLSAITSVGFHFNGYEILFGRIICYLFFLGSAVYLYKICRFFSYSNFALLVAVIYLSLPLGIYYSRALQIDFTTVFFSLAMLYYYIKGIDEKNLKLIFLGSLFGIFGFLIKAPYVFYLCIPLLYFIISRKKFNFFLKASPVFLIPAIIFLFWQNFTASVNSGSPDWYFIPGYFKFDNMSSWYFGNIGQRFNANEWENLLKRSVESVTSFAGILLFIPGIFLRLKNVQKTFFDFLFLGCLIYLMIFFPLNIIHDYYQIPLLMPAAFYISVTVTFIYEKLCKRNPDLAYFILIFIVLTFIVNGIWFTERWYYKIDMKRLESARIIKDNTGSEDLIISSIDDTDPRDPRILSQALRFGWSVRKNDLSEPLILNLKKEGADYLAITSEESSGSDPGFLKGIHVNEYKLSTGNYKLRLYQLR
jgi:4-amino-4-deoxy-L-arabinose transferase-like glycosyltransferase